MYETPDDLDRLQRLLDHSYDRAGAHARRVITPDRRVTAAELAERLTGMRLLVAATVTADGRPVCGPVDGIFYRGELWFGSAADSVRIRHLRARPWVSATHHEGEPFAVTVHGRAELYPVGAPTVEGFWEACREVYGPDWDDWAGEAVYARIEADRVLAFAMDD